MYICSIITEKKIVMKFIGIIPARYASTRFPAKPLALLGGKLVIQRVYEQVAGILDEAYVATDDERIEAAVKAFGGKVVMTSVDHKSGTDRCYEAFTKVGKGYDVIVNIQGDEPFIQPSQLEAVKACFDDKSTQIATLVKPFVPEDGMEALENVNSPKVVVNQNMNALYFSRSIIPYQRNMDKQDWLAGHTYYKHIGLYAYRADTLQEITSLPQSSLEMAESLEQLRWLENGYTIKVGVSEVETIGIDTPEDLVKAEEFLKSVDGEEYCVLAIDLEHFRLFNQIHGEKAGNHLLMVISDMLLEYKENHESILGYLGADDFAFVTEYDKDALAKLRQKIREEIRERIKTSGYPPAYGIYVIEDREEPVINMYNHATVALSYVKGNYTTRCCEYKVEMDGKEEEEIRLLSEIQKGIERDEFKYNCFCYYNYRYS